MPEQQPPRPSFRGRPQDLVVDVRTRLEFWMGHLEGAENVPVDVVADRLTARADLDRGAHILVYCASGARSALAAEMLRSRGFRNVTDGGGIGDARAHFKA